MLSSDDKESVSIVRWPHGVWINVFGMNLYGVNESSHLLGKKCIFLMKLNKFDFHFSNPLGVQGDQGGKCQDH